MNSHERLQSDLIDLVHRELSPWRALQVRLHLAHCADCRAEHKRLATLWRSLRSLHAPSHTSPRLRVKGKPMQARMILVTATAAFCAIGGPLITRSRQNRSYHEHSEAWQFFPEALPSVIINGKARGKIVVVPPGKTIDQVQESNTLLLDSDGSTDTIKVTVPTSSPWNRVAPFNIKIGKNRELHNTKGGLMATVYLLPLTSVEEQKLSEEQREKGRRFLEMYQNPMSFTRMDPLHGYLGEEDPGLVHWNLATNNNGSTRNTSGYAWKVLGQARVTMTFYSSVGQAPLVLQRKTNPVTLESLHGLSPRDLTLLPPTGEAPRIFWAQSSHAERLTNNVDLAKAIDQNGCWKSVARSGEFSGYGKHVVNGSDGKPQLILEVAPL